ncbi:uncharacterized protein DNG_03817 [Cephalotrichum gorgonifer]|uniref:Transcription factor Iwr1 domain-containing protein n=1 Tax=Cephalotrichum gorgonifer TaxID=2041049 RepID=A0AAE8MVR2_9PEZI|nr:uncharacterized protein DNG_03817 [Cephalotrichum gorgonifer]
MSVLVPPETIRVKRKRDDGTAPVSFLQLEGETKRHCSGESWVYQRVIAGASASREIRPVIHTSKPGDEHHATKQTRHGDATSTAQGGQEQQQRQFYMSRSSFVPSPDSPTKAAKKRRYSATLFIERDVKNPHQGVSATQGEPTHHTILPETASTRQGSDFGPEANQPPIGHGQDMYMDDANVATNEPRALKRPGKRTPTTHTPLPQFHGDMSKIAADMDAWTMSEIQRNIDNLELQHPTSSSQPGSRDALRFQPRVPARRYAERHPQEGGASTTTAPGGDAMALDSLDNQDWVEVVYHRVPASKLDSTIPRGDVGVIIFEDDKEKEFFYGAADSDSDAELPDDEDENAEDYYGADYPEDEVSEDDEYGHNPYQYRNNASDEEEFNNDNDDDDDFNTFSGDEEGGVIAGETDEEALQKIRRFVARHKGY